MDKAGILERYKALIRGDGENRRFLFRWEIRTMRREGDRLIIEPLVRQGLLSVLAKLKPLRETFADPDHDLLPVEEVKL